MSYDNPNRIKYSFGLHDLGAAGEVWALRGPKGKAGRLYDYGMEGVTETFTDNTTEATMAVGSASDPDAYGDELGLGTLAAQDAKSVRSTYDEIADKGEFDALMVDPDIPADEVVLLTCTPPTGGTPAGRGVPFVIIDWQN